MSTLRHLIAAGVGTAIALSSIDLSAAQELPPLPQSQPSPTIPTNSSIAQSAAPTNPQNIQANPAPEFLNPNANPLLFPTKSEEVQVSHIQPITLQQALDLARRNNRELQVGVLTLESSRAALRKAQAALYPTLDLETDLTRSDSASARLSNLRQSTTLFNQTQNTISNTFNGTLQLSYNLYTSGLREASIRAASEQVRFDELDVERLSEQLRLDVSNAYYDLQNADAQVQIFRAAVKEAEKTLQNALQLEQVGLGTQFDVLRTRVQLANANQDLTKGLSQQRIARRQLVQQLSLAQTVEVTAADPIKEAGTWKLSLEQSIVLSLKNRAELEQFLVKREIGEQQRQVALAGVKPQVSLFANYNLLDSLDDSFGPTSGYSIGARLQWSLFDGGSARSSAEQQEVNKAIMETQFANSRNQIRFQVEQAYFTLDSNKENIATATVAEQQATESLRLAQLRFEAGVGTLLDVITAQTELTRARGNRLTAILDYNRALASLQRYVSNLPDSQLFDVP